MDLQGNISRTYIDDVSNKCIASRLAVDINLKIERKVFNWVIGLFLLNEEE